MDLRCDVTKVQREAVEKRTIDVTRRAEKQWGIVYVWWVGGWVGGGGGEGVGGGGNGRDEHRTENTMGDDDDKGNCIRETV
jgi:hypothetical protein